MCNNPRSHMKKKKELNWTYSSHQTQKSVTGILKTTVKDKTLKLLKDNIRKYELEIKMNAMNKTQKTLTMKKKTEKSQPY